MPSYRIQIRRRDAWHEVDAGPVRVDELKLVLEIAVERRLRLDEPGEPRLLNDDEIIELHAGMAFSDVEWLRYVASPKHKPVPSRGVKGNLCPADIDADRAQELLDSSVRGADRKRWATDGERFYAAHPDNAGGWHGWPEPLERVPAAILRSWRADGTLP